MWGDFTVLYRLKKSDHLACVNVSIYFEDIEQAKIDIMLRWTTEYFECWTVCFDRIWYFGK